MKRWCWRSSHRHNRPKDLNLESIALYVNLGLLSPVVVSKHYRSFKGGNIMRPFWSLLRKEQAQEGTGRWPQISKFHHSIFPKVCRILFQMMENNILFIHSACLRVVDDVCGKNSCCCWIKEWLNHYDIIIITKTSLLISWKLSNYSLRIGLARSYKAPYNNTLFRYYNHFPLKLFTLFRQ